MAHLRSISIHFLYSTCKCRNSECKRASTSLASSSSLRGHFERIKKKGKVKIDVLRERIFLQSSYSFFGSLPYRRIIDNGLSNFHIIVSNTQKDPVFCHQPKKPQGSFAVVCFVVGYIKSYTLEPLYSILSF